MPRPMFYSYTPADDDANGLADDVAYAGGGYVLTANDAGDDLAHIITILGNAATNHSGKTFTVTGTDSDGFPQSEGIAGPNGVATVSTTKYFLTVTSVTVSATTGADTFDIGWTDVCIGPTVPLNRMETDFQVSLGVDISGTINFTVQHCLRDIRAANPSTLTWWPHATLVSKTADTDGNYASPVSATRLLINSSTSGATINFQILQGT